VGEDLFEEYYAQVLALIAVADEPDGERRLAAWDRERGRLVVLDDRADLLKSRRQAGDEETLCTLGHAAIPRFIHGDRSWRIPLQRENRFPAERTVHRFGDDW
jgi:hypothetical protein